MIDTAHFKIDPRLAMLLGETYRSTEQALKELVDNAWDADAENVWVDLPEPLSGAPIVIRDDGVGMDEREVRREYLAVARNRRFSRGDRTTWKNRLVKGRKGIGKFAGLMTANIMQIETRAAGTATFLTIPRMELLAADRDMEQFDLLINTIQCDPEEHGTTITLSELNQNLSFPSAEKLKELLVVEYGRQHDFVIRVNGAAVDVDDMPGEVFTFEAQLPEAGKVSLRFKIVDRRHRVRTPGIAIRVGGKIVGNPVFFGLDQSDEVPQAILRQLYGEVEADGLANDATADWGAFIENSKGFRSLEDWGSRLVAQELLLKLSRQIKLTYTSFDRYASRRIAALPPHLRSHAQQAIERLLLLGYGLSDEKLRRLAGVMLDALDAPERRA